MKAYDYIFDGQTVTMQPDAHDVLCRILENHCGGAAVRIQRILSSCIDGDGYRHIRANTAILIGGAVSYHCSEWILDTTREQVQHFAPGPKLNGGAAPQPKAPSRASTQEVIIQLGRGMKARFLNKGRKRVPIGDGMVMVNADIKLADGSKYDAVLEISEEDSGEHCGTGVFAGGGKFVWQDEPGFLEALGKTKEQVFPYRYRYRAMLDCSDHHIGEDGWSR